MAAEEGSSSSGGAVDEGAFGDGYGEGSLSRPRNKKDKVFYFLFFLWLIIY